MREVYLEGRLMTDRGLPDRNRRGDGYYSPSSRRYVFCPAGIWLPFADDIF